jgi:predicted nucleotidyltransferase component of viral defense system
MRPRSYVSAEAFKQALEQRIRDASPTGAEMARKRQRLVFDRFLARMSVVFGEELTLKGGLVLELRLSRARATKDIDVRLMGEPSLVLGRLQEAARHGLGDFLTFEIAPDDEHHEIRAAGMIYDGLRFRGECRLAGKIYGQTFGIDVGFADPLMGEPDTLLAQDTLAFAGIAPPKLRLYPLETHVAEKLHAYTVPRPRPNSRVKDLPDLALLSTVRAVEARVLRAALDQTFTFRRTHPLPASLPQPSDSWRLPYAALALQDDLRWPTLDEVTSAARAFLDPVLAGDGDATWDPMAERWSPR